MSQRFFASSLIESEQVTLADAEAHHLLHVMRAKVGDEVTLFDGSGSEFTATVTRLRRSDVELRVIERREVDRESPRRIVAGVPLPKGDRQKWLVEKCVELGVAKLTPLTTARSVARPETSSLERLGRAVIEASKQCGRNRLLEITEPRSAGEFFAEYGGTDGAVRWLAHVPEPGNSVPGPGSSPQRFAPVGHHPASDTVVFAVGPEGGWSDDEVTLAKSHGWQIVGLGRSILRVETAALTLAAILGAGSDLLADTHVLQPPPSEK